MQHTISISEEQRDNLFKLASYLAKPIPCKFSMYDFDDHFEDPYMRTECGSIGCAVGHGPYAGIEKISGENWYEYCQRVFGCGDTDACEDFPLLWYWCFDAEWYYVDNTSVGAAQRILYFLERGIPAQFRSIVVTRFRYAAESLTAIYKDIQVP